MGLLDGVLGGALGSVLGKLGQGGAGQPGQPNSVGQGSQLGPLIQIALQLLQQSGGLAGILEKFKQAGFANQAASWVSTGPNLPISPDQVNQVLGNDTINQLAGQVGLQPTQLSQGLAEVLPDLINQGTPNGQLSAGDEDALTNQLQGLLKGFSL
jgi:uncharacterized protein YidB (DUF937 family)